MTGDAAYVTVLADRERCCQSGRCSAALPEVFDNDEDGVVVLLMPQAPMDLLADIESCVDLCPCLAISYELPSGVE